MNDLDAAAAAKQKETPAIKELREEIEGHRDKAEKLYKQLKALAAIAPVGKSRDEIKDAKDETRRLLDRQHREIDERREKIKKLREADHEVNGATLAMQFLEKQLGVTEVPPGSNWGHPVQDWILWMGYTNPVPWCGVLAGYAAAKVGGANIITPIRLGYSGFITEDARAGRNGLKGVPVADAQVGDIFAYGTVHVGTCVGPTRNGQVEAIEGNTSPGTEGSQYNGGCVAHKFRPVSFVTTCARPDWD